MASQILTEQIKILQSRPGHEKVKHILCNILKEQLEAKDDEITLEERLLCRGRIDALWGRTIFEVKRDLRREQRDTEHQIKQYIQSKEKETNTKYVGITTDGKEYTAYCLLYNELKEINKFSINKDKPSDFIQWLESVILIKEQLQATPEIICKEIGQGSPLCKNSLLQINILWNQAKNKPDIRLKYNLWKKSVDIVYGKDGSDESLFIEHTYLTIISKAIAHIAFFEESPLGNALLNGKKFEDSNVSGVIEDDFFSWITYCNKGNELVQKIASHIKRFNFSTIEADILKGLYEGLIRQEQRHKIGEYYTPDWLAERICKEVIKKPLEQRVIDPASGSGTFLFHAIRLLISKAKTEKINTKETIKLVSEKIAGIDIHPVAVIFSRITYLLALLSKIKEIETNRPDKITIPVYLGDSLQWSKDEILGKYELKIQVPEDKQTNARRRELIFPQSICEKSDKFDTILYKMIELAGKYKEKSIFSAWIENEGVDDNEHKRLSETYENLLKLQQENRNHIWGYVARNLTRPIWLSSERQKADVVIGNPPWLRFNAMNQDMQQKFKSECRSTLLWETGNTTKFQTSQDISTYFFIMSAYLYMRKKGTLAFVMPYGVMNGEHHFNFRAGRFEISRSEINLKFKTAWVFDSRVKNLFKVPSCVLFSKRRKQNEEPLPKNIISFKGKLPVKNCNLEEAKKHLSSQRAIWPQDDFENRSYYFDKFKQGASLVPRRFCFVEKIQRGRLGSSSTTPLVKSVVSNLDKAPWKDINPLELKIESQFLKPVYTGKSIAPFRILNHNTAIIPWDNEKGVLDSSMAERSGYTNLSNYLEKVEKLWSDNSNGSMIFKRRINYNATLENQFPISKLKVVYTASGTNVASVLLEDSTGIIDTSLYYTTVNNKNEGIYLEGILNSDFLIEKIRNLQAQGQWGARHISRHLLKPPIPKYNPQDPLHQDIVSQTQEIKIIAQKVKLDLSCSFIKTRRQIKQKIKNTGTVWKHLNQNVETLLNNQPFKKTS